MRLKTVHFTFNEFLEARDLWNQAVQRSLDDNIFLTWEWLSSWWKHFGDKRRFLVIAVTDGNEISAAAPFMASTDSRFGLKLTKLQFIGSPESDYQSLLLMDGKERLATSVIEYVHNAVPDWDLIELREIPETCGTARILSDASAIPWKLKQEVEESCPYIPLPRTFEDYLQTLSSQFRKGLKRCESSLARDYNAEFRMVEDLHTIDAAMSTLFELHQKRRAMKGEVGVFADPSVRNFHLDVAKSFAHKGWLVLAFLMLNQEPAAVQYAFRYSGKLYYYQSGFDPRYSEYSVGSLLHMRLIEHCIRNGLREYDFTRGGEPYKMHWGTLTRMNLQFTAMRREFVPLLARSLELAEMVARASWSERRDWLASCLKRP